MYPASPRLWPLEHGLSVRLYVPAMATYSNGYLSQGDDEEHGLAAARWCRPMATPVVDHARQMHDEGCHHAAIAGPDSLREKKCSHRAFDAVDLARVIVRGHPWQHHQHARAVTKWKTPCRR